MSGSNVWRPAPPHLRSQQDEVHVWRTTLKQPASVVEDYWKLLSEDERNRANAFHFRRDRDRFVVARGVLRKLLSRYLQRQPGQIRFCYGPFGKPDLEDEGSELRFNLSHAGDVALYAITGERQIGIDIESLRDAFTDTDIAEHFFARGEVETLRHLPSEVRTRAFFNCWTRKEAYIKARGDGLSLSLNSFEVSLSPGEPTALLHNYEDEREVSRWSLQELDPGDGYVAAFAVEGRDFRQHCWQWSEQGMSG